MTQYTYKDIEEFLLDERFLQWAKRDFEDSNFDLELYKQQHPGSEEKIEVAIAMIRALRVVDKDRTTAQEHKMKSYLRMMNKHELMKRQQEHRLRNQRIIISITSVAALFMICIGSYFLLNQSKALEDGSKLTAAMIDSLSQSGQVQVLLNGKQAAEVDKNNAEIRVDVHGDVIVDDQVIASTKGAKVTVSQIVVPYGKRSKIILPDGSSLWINSGSYISYNSDFAENRKLTVQGEVFLDVKKDEAHPFIVKTNHLEVQVLGTAFNVTDYAKENLPAVVLVRGSVEVKVDNNKKRRLLPSQRLAMESGVVEVDEVDVYSYICWKDDIMNFDGKKLSYILRTLSRYYNTQIEVTDNLEDQICYGSLDLNCSLEEVLESISLTTPFKIVRKGEVIYLTPKK